MSQILNPNYGDIIIPPQVATLYVTPNGDAVSSGNILNINPGNGVSTSASGNTVTISVINDGFPWSDQSDSFAAVIQNGYFCTGALTVTLPSAGLITGNTIIIYVDTARPVVIQAAGGQQIEISGTLSSTAGSATSNTQGNIVTLVYRSSDSTWHAISSQGTFTLA